jgi:2-desacetyl-2-hydroxyethyl bacteriochlorophyllide A dehydrogenase
MRTVEWRAPGTLRLVEREEPVAGPGQAVIEVAACGICGSDLHAYADGYGATPGQVLGHEFCGRVVSAPGVDGLAEGERVSVRPMIPCGACARCAAGEGNLCEAGHGLNIGFGSPGALAERVLVPRAIVGETVFPLPDAIDDRAGALVEPLAVALHAVRLADAGTDDVALVLGAGTIGQGVTRLLRLRGVATLVVTDPSPLRRDRARALGADVVVDPRSERVVEVMRSITGPGWGGRGARADVVIDCAGSPAAFGDGLRSVRHGGRMVIAAMYGRQMELNLDRLTEKELVVRGSFAYGDDAFPEIIRLLAGGQIDAEALISDAFGLDDVEAAFRRQLDRDRSLKVLVIP